MKKSAQVVMLPTNEKTNIWLDNFGTGLYNCPTGATGVIYQHLYILSDEEIKEGDYHVAMRIVKTNGDKAIAFTDQEQLDAIAEIGGAKKIIATTDKSIILPERFPSFTYLPQPSQSFLEKFVEEYNKGNVITEVLVEYEEIQVLKQTLNEGFGSYYHKAESEFVLKVNPTDNTITIRKAKDSWNREEVIELIQKYSKECTGWSWFETDEKWIEENL